MLRAAVQPSTRHGRGPVRVGDDHRPRPVGRERPGGRVGHRAVRAAWSCASTTTATVLGSARFAGWPCPRWSAARFAWCSMRLSTVRRCSPRQWQPAASPSSRSRGDGCPRSSGRPWHDAPGQSRADHRPSGRCAVHCRAAASATTHRRHGRLGRHCRLGPLGRPATRARRHRPGGRPRDSATAARADIPYRHRGHPGRRGRRRGHPGRQQRQGRVAAGRRRRLAAGVPSAGDHLHRHRYRYRRTHRRRAGPGRCTRPRCAPGGSTWPSSTAAASS